MPTVPLGRSVYRRRGARTAEVAFLNMVFEADPTNLVDGTVRFQRPGLSRFSNVGQGPIRGLFRRFGVLGSQYATVSGEKLYFVGEGGTPSLVGAISGADLCSIDGSATRVIIVSDGVAYSTDGITIVRVNMPDDVPVSSVAYIAGYFVLTQANSQRFYWLAPGDVDPDPLNFASSENSPDSIVRVIRLLDELWFFGQQTTEVFQLTGNLDAPFAPIGGRLYEKGCANKDSVFVIDNTLFWIGNDLIAYRANTTPQRISDHSMEERLRVAGGAAISAWAFSYDGHTFYCVRTGDSGTFVFDVENPNGWGRFKSFGQETWRPMTGAQITGDIIIAGDDADGILWQLDSRLSNDDGKQMERELTGGIVISGPPAKCANFTIQVATGWADIVGTYTDPIVQLSFSDDGGETWSSWLEMNLGLQGQYLTEVTWRQLGQMKAPGRLFKVRMTDDSLLRISYAQINSAVSSS